MKKATIAIALTAALFTLTSCEKHLHITSELDPYIGGNNASSVSALSEMTTLPSAPQGTTAATNEVIPQGTTAAANEAIPQGTTAAANEVIPQGTENISATESAPNTQKTAFDKGRLEGNTYISEQAGLKLVFPENADFMDEANLYTQYMMPTRFMSEEERNHHLTGVPDLSVTYGDSSSRVNVWFYDLKQRYPDEPHLSIAEFIQREELNYSSNFEVTDIQGPEKITLGGNEYTKISYICSSYPHISYYRMIDDDTLVAVQTSDASAEDIESRFKAIS